MALLKQSRNGRHRGLVPKAIPIGLTPVGFCLE